jgi:hypothetical protein
MRDKNDRVSVCMKSAEKLHDFHSGLGIQISCGLVGKNDGRIVHQRTGKRDALTLAAREFSWLVARAI